MKFPIKKNKLVVILIVISTIIFSLLIFVQPYTSSDNAYDGLMSVISNTAKDNKFNTTLVAYDGNIGDAEFTDNYFAYEMDEEGDDKNHSVLVSPIRANINELIVGGLQIKSSIIIKKNVRSYKSLNDNYKLIYDDLWYYGQPFLYPTSNVTKHISISENIAEKIIVEKGLESFEDLKGMIVEYKNYNENGDYTTEDCFIRGVIISEQGAMGQYEDFYGKDIVFFLDDFVNSLKVEAHFYFGVSIMNNKYSFKSINKEILESLYFRNGDSDTTINTSLIKEYGKYLEIINFQIFQSKAIIILQIFLALILVIFSAYIISKFKNSMTLLVFQVLSLLVFNELLTIVFSINKYSISWSIHNNIMRSGSLLIYLMLLVILTIIMKGARPKNE